MIYALMYLAIVAGVFILLAVDDLRDEWVGDMSQWKMNLTFSVLFPVFLVLGAFCQIGMLSRLCIDKLMEWIEK